MDVEWAEGLIGLLIGAGSIALLKLKALKELTLDLHKVGVSLGIKGFKEEPAHGVRIGKIEGSHVEVAGRDINKNSHLYQTIQAAMQSAAGEVKSNGAKIERTFQWTIRDRSDEFAVRLQETERDSGSYLENYAHACFSHPPFVRQIADRLDKLSREGWTSFVLRPLDNVDAGLMISVSTFRDLQ